MTTGDSSGNGPSRRPPRSDLRPGTPMKTRSLREGVPDGRGRVPVKPIRAVRLQPRAITVFSSEYPIASSAAGASMRPSSTKLRISAATRPLTSSEMPEPAL